MAYTGDGSSSSQHMGLRNVLQEKPQLPEVKEKITTFVCPLVGRLTDEEMLPVVSRFYSGNALFNTEQSYNERAIYADAKSTLCHTFLTLRVFSEDAHSLTYMYVSIYNRAKGEKP